ncbi:hypothetical protein ACYSNR_10920 [Enterococcus sp. LJL128]
MYTDFIFMLSIFDILYDENFSKVCKLLHINWDDDWMAAKYDQIISGQGEAVILHSVSNQHELLFFDLHLGFTDQHNMVLIGVRCSEHSSFEIKPLLKKIYDTADVKSLQMEQGGSLLDEKIKVSNYPKKMMTVTKINGQEVYEYEQRLECY